MADARNRAINWFGKNKHLIMPLLAFLIPLIVRVIPEILMGPYLVGFDTMSYYAANTLTWMRSGVTFTVLLGSSPLIYTLLMGLTSVGAPIVITLKVLGPLLLGFLGFSVYLYANKALSWSPSKSLVVATLSTLFFVSLRISWDMFRSELATVFLFLALVIIHRKITRKNGLLLSIVLALIVLSHQLIAIIMFAIILATIASLYLKKKKAELQKLIVCALPASFLLLTILYINFILYSSPIMGFSGNYSGGFEQITVYSHTALIIDTLGFFAFCYLPLIPFLIFGIKKGLRSNIELKAWIAWVLIPIIIVIISPNSYFLGGILPYRWILLLTYPLSFYAVEGLFSIKCNWYKAVYKIIIAIVIAALSIGFIVLPNNQALEYFGSYPTYVPKSMLQNTLQLSDCQDTVNALSWASNNLPSNGRLLVHEAFYGWANLEFDSSKFVPYFFDNLTIVTNNFLQTNPDKSLYLVWWVNGAGWYGQPTVPSPYVEIYHSGNIAIYKYSTAN